MPLPTSADPVLAVVGENIIDLIPTGASGPSGQVYEPIAGGSPANIAVAASRLGTPTGLVARVSRDAYGEQVARRLAADGVLTTFLVDADEPSSVARVSFDAQRRATYDFEMSGTADWQWRPGELPAPLPDSVRVLHVGSLAAYLEPGSTAILDLVRREKARGEVAISLDPNVRLGVIDDREATLNRIEEFVALSDVVKASDEDLDALYPGVPVAEAAADWHARGPSLVIVTQGARGALAVSDRPDVMVPSPPITLVDTVGAGDTFMGALLHGLLVRGLQAARADAGSVREVLARIDVGDVLREAVTAAGLACEREGADPPTAAELAEALARLR